MSKLKQKKSNLISDKVSILKGLKNIRQKRIDSKYFYDEEGSILFEKITNLKEYYQTRTEMKILCQNKIDINKNSPISASVVEFGSGSNKKIKKFISFLNAPSEYIPIDISEKYLFDKSKEFSKFFPKIKVLPICSDFQDISTIKKKLDNRKNLIGFFPGSTIGNISPYEAKKLLIKFSLLLGSQNKLLVGIDLIKKKKILEKAYNDDQGITERFNKNLLVRFNKEFNASINPKDFKHLAFFNSRKSRIEMHLKSKINQHINIFDEIIILKKGETIHTENSYKYTIQNFSKLSEQSNFEILNVFTDSDNLFALFFLKVK
tara:strand:- start:5027 stop:5983 length:957 start_codon:yes stop_codon:yes gene_type:complete